MDRLKAARGASACATRRLLGKSAFSSHVLYKNHIPPKYGNRALMTPSAMPEACELQSKPLHLFIPMIYSGGIWSACGGLLSTPRAFPTGTIGDTFYETITIIFKAS